MLEIKIGEQMYRFKEKLSCGDMNYIQSTYEKTDITVHVKMWMILTRLSLDGHNIKFFEDMDFEDYMTIKSVVDKSQIERYGKYSPKKE